MNKSIYKKPIPKGICQLSDTELRLLQLELSEELACGNGLSYREASYLNALESEIGARGWTVAFSM